MIDKTFLNYVHKYNVRKHNMRITSQVDTTCLFRRTGMQFMGREPKGRIAIFFVL